MRNRVWLSAYIFYHGDLNKFLHEIVSPVVDRIITNELACQFFFIRYWEKGQHVRLRFKGDSNVLEKIVKPILTECLDDFFFTDANSGSVNNTNLDQKFVQFNSYIPEWDRYGGRLCMEVAEQQFERSSVTALNLLAENKASDYSVTLTQAIILHIVFSFAAQMQRGEVIDFYSMIYENWSGLVNRLDQRARQADELFLTSYKKHKDELTSICTSLLHTLEGQKLFEDKWINEWFTWMAEVDAKIKWLQKKGQVITPNLKLNESHPTQVQQRMYIYKSFIHMTNNRIGVKNVDEAYLGFLIKEALSCVIK